MNKRDREQLRASIARDLIEGQGINSPTRELLKNRWNKSDLESYEQNRLRTVPAGKIVSALEAVANRTPAKINSFRYFVKALARSENPRSRAWRKKKLERIVRRIRENAVGRSDYSTSDFIEDVKRACARESITFDNDILNELAQ